MRSRTSLSMVVRVKARAISRVRVKVKVWKRVVLMAGQEVEEELEVTMAREVLRLVEMAVLELLTNLMAIPMACLEVRALVELRTTVVLMRQMALVGMFDRMQLGIGMRVMFKQAALVGQLVGTLLATSGKANWLFGEYPLVYEFLFFGDEELKFIRSQFPLVDSPIPVSSLTPKEFCE